jgi:hypothetical protein
MTWLGALTRSRTAHRVAPSSRRIIGEVELRSLLLPLATIDGDVWGVPGKIPIVYCQYTDSNERGLRFRRDEQNRLWIQQESRERLLEWARELTEMECEIEVPKDAEYKAGYLKLHPEATSALTDRDIAVRVAAEPEWLQRDQTPLLDGRPMRFLFQAYAEKFTDYVADFEIFTFADDTARELVYVWQVT